MRLEIGAPIFAKDGQIGHVEHVIINPQTNEVTHFVVNTGGLSPRQVVVAVEAVVAYRNRGVHVALETDDVAELPDFMERDFLIPPDEWVPPAPYPAAAALWPVTAQNNPPIPVQERENVPDPSIDIFKGMEVDCSDGTVGTVDEIVLDPATNRVQEIVIGSGWLFPKTTRLPVGPDVLVTPSRIVLPCAKDELEEFLGSRQRGGGTDVTSFQ